MLGLALVRGRVIDVAIDIMLTRDHDHNSFTVSRSHPVAGDFSHTRLIVVLERLLKKRLEGLRPGRSSVRWASLCVALAAYLFVGIICSDGAKRCFWRRYPRRVRYAALGGAVNQCSCLVTSWPGARAPPCPTLPTSHVELMLFAARLCVVRYGALLEELKLWVGWLVGT